MTDFKLPFQRLVESLLDRALTSGLETPITFVMVSSNGYVSAARYTQENGIWEGALLVEGDEASGHYPVNLCFFDPAGKIFNAKLTVPCEEQALVH